MPIPGLFSAEAATINCATTGSTPSEAAESLQPMIEKKVASLYTKHKEVPNDNKRLQTRPKGPEWYIITINIELPHPPFYAVGTLEGIKFRPWGAWERNDDDDFDD